MKNESLLDGRTRGAWIAAWTCGCGRVLTDPDAVLCLKCGWARPHPAPTLPPVGEREWFEYRYKSAGSSEWGPWLRFGTRRGRDGEADRMHGMGLAVETRASRPSPAPSGEPVRFEYRVYKSYGWTPWMGDNADGTPYTREERDRYASSYPEGTKVETRDLYAAAPRAVESLARFGADVLAALDEYLGFHHALELGELARERGLLDRSLAATELLTAARDALAIVAAAPHPDGQGVGE